METITGKVRIERSLETRTTRITATGAGGQILVQITGPLTARQRRALGVSFFRHIRPWIQYFRSGAVTHLDYAAIDFNRIERRGLRLFEASDFRTSAGRNGFRIRLFRLELGWSQERLSRKAGVARTHLSAIERGQYRARSSTLARIERALLEENQPD